MNGYIRLKELYQESLNQNTSLTKIVDYLLRQEDMNNNYLNEEKSLSQMNEYIINRAKKFANNNVAIIEDNVVYNWAIKYFSLSNEELGIIEEKKEVETHIINKEINNKNSNINQLSLELNFDL